MIKSDLFKIVRDLEFDEKKIVYKQGNVTIQLHRPSKLSKRFNKYDPKKNFQIWLKEGEREFRPNHLRVFIDLNLRTRSRPELKEKLLLAFDNVFYGADPERELKRLSKENFEHYLNDLTVIGILTQLLLIEQEYVYAKESKFDPPTLFFQGWVREFTDSPKEIDNMCMSVALRQPPAARYVNRENKKDGKYNPDLKKLWYIES